MSGADKYDLLFVTAGSAAFEKSIGREMSEQYRVAQRTYSQARIFHFFRGKEESGYFVSSYKNLILVSTSATLVEESIRQINAEFNLKKDPHFQKLYDTRNPRDLANLYLNLQEAPKFINQLLPSGDASFMKRMGHWAELDIQINNQELIMSGLTLFPLIKPTT
ncbi:MAG: hypothetical protein U5L96_20615 [Owenweeksia sp.]|nr:hypothetical protein [Owenweeksia sp.]